MQQHPRVLRVVHRHQAQPLPLRLVRLVVHPMTTEVKAIQDRVNALRDSWLDQLDHATASDEERQIAAMADDIDALLAALTAATTRADAAEPEVKRLRLELERAARDLHEAATLLVGHDLQSHVYNASARVLAALTAPERAGTGTANG